MIDEDSGTAYLVEVKRNLNKALKEEKMKFYRKAAAIPLLKDYSIHYLYAGIDNGDIVILGEKDNKFVL